MDGVLRRRVVGAQNVPATTAPGVTDRAAEALVRRARLAPRSAELLEAVSRLDTTTDPRAAAQIMEWIGDHFQERGGGELLGLFGRCYLGSPFVDHMMTLSGHICEHYSAHDAVPPGFAPARAYARSDAYAYVEVYADGLVIPIRNDGSALI